MGIRRKGREMDYGTLKALCLQKLFIIEGSEAVENDSTRGYLSALPGAVNEAMALLVTGAGPGRLPPRHIEIPVHPHKEIHSGEEWTARDLRALDARFYQLAPAPLLFQPEGCYQPGRQEAGFRLEGDSLLWLRSERPGKWIVYYYVYPLWVSGDTPDGTELDLPPELAALIPLYVASQLYKDDDLSIATQYRNEFEAGRAMLLPPESRETGEPFSSVTGWI